MGVSTQDANRLISQLERHGVVGPWKPRNVLVSAGEKAAAVADIRGVQPDARPAAVSDSVDRERVATAAELVIDAQFGSTAMVQRRLGVGFSEAGRLMDELHRRGIVGAHEGPGARDVLIPKEDKHATLAQISGADPAPAATSTPEAAVSTPTARRDRLVEQLGPAADPEVVEARLVADANQAQPAKAAIAQAPGTAPPARTSHGAAGLGQQRDTTMER